MDRDLVGAPHSMRVPVTEAVGLNVLAWPAADPAAGAPPFVLLHGLASTARSWDPVAGRLVAAGHDVFAVDLRGHGLSDKPDDGYDMETLAGDLVGLLDRLGLDRPVLAGHSLGAFVIVDALARYPRLASAVTGTVLVEGGLVDAKVQFASLDACLSEVSLPPVAGSPAPRMLGYLHHRYPDWSDERIAGLMAGLEIRADGTVDWWLSGPRLEALARALWRQDSAALWPKVAAPTLVVVADTGDEAWTEQKRAAAAAAGLALPRARVRWLEGDHDIHAHRPREVADLILEALADGFFGGGVSS